MPKRAKKPVKAWAVVRRTGLYANSVSLWKNGAEDFRKWVNGKEVVRVLIIDPRFYRITPRRRKK